MLFSIGAQVVTQDAINLMSEQGIDGFERIRRELLALDVI